MGEKYRDRGEGKERRGTQKQHKNAKTTPIKLIVYTKKMNNVLRISVKENF